MTSSIHHNALIVNPKILETYNHDTVYTGHPEAVYSVNDWQTVSEILADCHEKNISVTPCGSQTSMTGASVANEGVVIAMAPQKKIIDISRDTNGNPFALVEPGVILADLKKAAQDLGFDYPPDPTSFHEAQIGGTIATNATGEESFRFGPTRAYVEELDLLLADGTKKNVRRTRPFIFTQIKNTAGYFLNGEEIDEIIGSEGTLALIQRAKLRLVKNEKKLRFLVVMPFSNLSEAITAVTNLTAQTKIKPRSLELIGPGAANYFRQAPTCPKTLTVHNIFLYARDDAADTEETEKKITLWFDILRSLYEKTSNPNLIDSVFVAQKDKDLEDFRQARHFIPAKINEEYFSLNQKGAGKIGTDWWVPIKNLENMMNVCLTEVEKTKIPFAVFAHIGNGHPHWNFLTRTPEEWRIAKDLTLKHYKRAVAMGGGVAGEHGIGKIKKDLLKIQHPPSIIKKMTTIKTRWDSKNILGRGNIF